MRRIAEHIARTTTNGGEFLQALNPEALGFSDILKPDDPPSDASMVNVEKWKYEYRNWNDRTNRRQEASRAAFAIVLGQCSEAVRSKMKTYQEWMTIESSIDVIGLA